MNASPVNQRLQGFFLSLYSGNHMSATPPLTSMTHPSSQSDGHANPLPPPRLFLCPVIVGYSTFFWFLCSGTTPPPPSYHTSQMAEPMATTTTYRPHAHVADMEVAEKHFHVLATSLDGAERFQRCCWDMEVLFSSFLISAGLVYCSLTMPHNPNCARGTGSAKTHGWSKTTRVFLVL